MDKTVYDSITRKIISCAMAVHTALGNGFQELIYQRALEIELAANDIVFEREKEMPIYYRKVHIGTRRVDFFCKRWDNGRVEGDYCLGKCALSSSD